MNETLCTIHELRSTHGNFTDRDVPAADLETILNAALRAANASARQSYSVVVLDSRPAVKELTGYPGSRCLVFLVDYNRLTDTAARMGHDFDPDNIVDFVTACVDAALVAQTAAIAARSLGIDSLFTNAIHRIPLEKCYELLRLPEQHCFPLIALVLGYADREPAHRTGRLTGKGVVHRGGYEHAKGEELDAIIAAYDDPAFSPGPLSNWRSQGFCRYLDWFYAVWSRRMSEAKRAEFLHVLDRAGFLKGMERGSNQA
jgi:nitroreductase